MRTFNIAGPCNPKEDYMLPAEPRIKAASFLVQQNKCFAVYAPRQSGKTTCIQQLANSINATGEKLAIYCSLETASSAPDVPTGMQVILDNLYKCLTRSVPNQTFDLDWDALAKQPYLAVQFFLSTVCQTLDKPLVLFLDEIDSLANELLLSLLRQLRAGYISRFDMPFPSSIALVGMSNIRDYKIKIRPDSETLGSASPFNIITQSLTIRLFTQEEIAALYQQHTAETGQIFEPGVIERVYYWTSGQPWLVNALAATCIYQICEYDFSVPITVDMIDRAEQMIVKERGTHIDSLLARLRESRVQRIIQPMLTGAFMEGDSLNDDVSYVTEMGLLKTDETTKSLVPANRMYAEIIPRYLTYDMQTRITAAIPSCPWVRDNGLDMDGLLKGFQQFWRENSEVVTKSVQSYTEALPHLTLQAFLQRVINGGGHIQREYALGRRSLDLLIEFRGGCYPVELKIKGAFTTSESLDQLADYMDTCGCSRGWLVIIDKSSRPWDEKIAWDTYPVNDKTITVVRA